MDSISSVHNARIKGLVRLRERSERLETGRFCVETVRELERAMRGGMRVREVYVCSAMVDERERDLVERVRREGTEVVEVTERVLEKAAYRENPEGLIAVVEARVGGIKDLKWLADGLWVVCSGLEKPGNVGAIMRTASGAGVSAVVLDRADADVFNPNCIRASTGAVFGLLVVCADRGDVLEWMIEKGVRLIAATPEGTKGYTEVEMKGATALVVGAEAEGLDGQWKEAADACVSIPMAGEVDSLNVSVTAALLMYEAVRQRGGV